MPFVYDGVSSLEKTDKVDGGECARLVQHYIPHIGRTSTWAPGERVMDVLASGRRIEPGTAIATFVNGRYPTHGHRHAAFFEYEVNSCTYNRALKRCAIMGIVVMDQWNSDSHSPRPKLKVSRRQIKPYGNRVGAYPISDNADMFYIIENRSTVKK